MSQGNSFEAREKRNKKRSSIVKMSELRVENLTQSNDVIKKEVENKGTESNRDEINNSFKRIDTPVNMEGTVKNNLDELIDDTKAQINIGNESIDVELNVECIDQKVNNVDEFIEVENNGDSNEVNINNINNVDLNKENFFNLNIKNDVFEGKMTTVRVYDDILETLKKYATMKNYPIIEFTNKIITFGLDDIEKFSILEISEIKFKNNTSRSIMYNLTDIMEEKINNYIVEMNKKGYKISRNIILNVIINETLKKFYIN